MNSLRHPRTLASIVMLLALAAIACGQSVTPTPSSGEDAMATAVAATLEAIAQATASAPPPPEATAPPTAPPPAEEPTPTPPSDGVSLNCDGTYQRFRITDGGASGKTAWVDNWQGGTWVNVWSLAGGNPMEQQIEDDAGLYTFGGCQQFVAVPIRIAGSGTILHLRVYAWNGAGLTEVYNREGVHGQWEQSGNSIMFEESVYLYGEPNCCPCNTQLTQHSWNGSAFVETLSQLTPTYEGTPPPECSP
ncbi:MAG: hypothetical protein PVJ07_06810 [Anaerolineales bacterium]